MSTSPNPPQELTKGYDPSQVEDRWYAHWMAQHAFKADPRRAFNGHGLSEETKAKLRSSGKKESYSIVIPPPNVTGILHMGHVLNNTVQDILARRKRMQGYEVLWLPGIDHAGIATQSVVERQLKKDEKKSRHDLGRDAFLEKVWSWKDKHGGIILEQLRKLGCSCDWSRTVFTMDGLDPRDPNPRINYAKWVDWVFVKLYEKGLIYRGRRMVNWCVVSHTALSDEEVEMRETKGSLWHIRYPLKEDPTKVMVVATTRPETMLGDTAVAVHPDDERYRSWIGKDLVVPLIGRTIPIIADEHVDPKFGTGCVKVTPAHDPADFDMGNRHGLEQIQVIGFDGKMTEAAGETYKGLDRGECRKKVVEALEASGALEKIEPHTHNVGYSDRAGVPAEPMVSDQWFLKYPAIKESLEAVSRGQTRFWPDRWAKVYEHWMTNIRDWCISRQLWWGHRIPVWSRLKPGAEEPEYHVSLKAPTSEGWTQDPDVLDTWFSSWLWPFATLVQDPEHFETELKNPHSDISIFYPTSDLVTAPEILFFWVARMMMAGHEFKESTPFANVYFTGIVRDRSGRKMSKSLGNSPDPLDLIAKYGADGLRFGTMRCAPLGMDVRFDEQQVELGRNFCNKLWNAARLRLTQTTSPADFNTLTSNQLSSEDKAVLIALDQAMIEIEKGFDGYEFNQVTARLYELFWTSYCDWYLEASKSALYGQDDVAKGVTLAVMDRFLNVLLRLLHPFMPFITEELWHALNCEGESIQFAPWPAPFSNEERSRLGLDSEVQNYISEKHQAVSAGRNLKASYNVPASRKVPFFYTPKGHWHLDEREVTTLQTLLQAESLKQVDSAPQGAASAVTNLGTLYLPLEGLVDVAAEKSRLQGQIGKIEKELSGIQSKLKNEGFVSRAPKEAVEQHRKREAELIADIQKIRDQIDLLK